MDKKVVLLGSVTILSSLFAFHSFSQQESLNTVEKCASLLPSGHNFSVTIEAKIDTDDGTPTMSGSMNISDGTQASNPEMVEKVAPFKDCVVKLLK